MIGNRNILTGVSLLAVAAALAGAGKAAAQEGPAGLGYSSYVALGDSYSSGEGASTVNANDSCDRSQLGWVYRIEADLGGVPFVHAACTGATTADIMAQGPKFTAQGGMSQIDYLPEGDPFNGALITIQIGGNDLKLEAECIAGKRNEDGTRGDIPEECMDVDYAYNNLLETVSLLSTNLDYIYRAVQARAPKATIVAIGYPHLFSTTNPDCDKTVSGALVDADMRQKLNALVDAGNKQIKETANNLGILAITDEIATAFEGHEMCSTDEWLVSADWFLPPAKATRGSQTGHPSDWGHQMMAEVIGPLLPYNVNTEPQSDSSQVSEPGASNGDDGNESP